MSRCNERWFIACYKKEKRLPVNAFRLFLEESPSGIRLLFVNDGSRDATLEMLMELAEEFPAVSVPDQPQNIELRRFAPV